MFELLGQDTVNMAEVCAEATKAVQRTEALQLAFINVLRSLGVSYIVAEEEADAQIGHLYRKGLVYGAISEDADLYAHGVRRLVHEIRRQTFVWSVVDLELIDVTQHITDKDILEWKRGLYAGMKIDADLALALWCALVANDYHTGGITGVGKTKAGKAVKAVMESVVLSEALWDNVLAVANKAGVWCKTNLTAKASSNAEVDIRTGMTYFFCQKVFDPTAKEAARPHGTPPWLELADEGSVFTADERSAGAHLQGADSGELSEITVLPDVRGSLVRDLPLDTDGRLLPVLHIGDLAVDVPGMVLPNDVAQCDRAQLETYIKSFAGNTGHRTGLSRDNLPQLRDKAKALQALVETNPSMARLSRQDPNGHGTAWYILRLQGGPAVADPLQVAGLPPEESFVFTNLYAVTSKTPKNFPQEVLKAWKGRLAPENRLPELSKNVRARTLQKAKQLSLSLHGCNLALSLAKIEQGQIWYRGRVPASKTSNARYDVFAQLEVTGAPEEVIEKKVTRMDVQCTSCPGGLRGSCTHAGTFAELVYTLRKRAAALSELRELICTSHENSWDRAALDRDTWDPTVPVHGQTYEGAGRSSERGSTKRRAYQEHEFDPRTRRCKQAKRNDPAVVLARSAWMKALRTDAWAVRNNWTLEPVQGRNGESEIGRRHQAGQRCRLALDLYEGDSSEGEYDYAAAEVWPSIAAVQVD